MKALIFLLLFPFMGLAQSNNKQDTTVATITVAHKIKKYKPSITFYGYIIKDGKTEQIFDMCWNPLPIYYKVIRVKNESRILTSKNE